MMSFYFSNDEFKSLLSLFWIPGAKIGQLNGITHVNLLLFHVYLLPVGVFITIILIFVSLDTLLISSLES